MKIPDQERANIQRAMTDSPAFMQIGDRLKRAGIKYTFSTEAPMPPTYLVMIGRERWFIVNEKHADDGSFIVNGMGLTQ